MLVCYKCVLLRRIMSEENTEVGSSLTGEEFWMVQDG
jgi:hypothetical protein